MGKRILLLASGTGSLAAAILDALESGEISATCVALLSDKDSPALRVAERFNIPSIYLPMRQLRAEWDREIFETANRLAPDLVVSVGFMRLLAADFVSTFNVINTHPSLLPLFPGAHAVRDALAAGSTVTGSTVHRVDAGLDTGPIISQRQIDIHPGEDGESLHERIKIVERELIVEVLAAYGETGTL